MGQLQKSGSKITLLCIAELLDNTILLMNIP